MQRTLDIAGLGLGKTSPNPMVGAVIVYNDVIIGEGYHKQYGGAHAEVNAIEDVKQKELLKDSTMYVNLEPCNHFGQTPPCTDLILKYKIPRIVLCNYDPHPAVSGKGIEKLKTHGVKVEVGVLEKEGKALNKRFFTFHKKKRPYIILKWAETKDRFIAKENFDSKWISGELSRKLVHKWRTENDGIMVGFQTALYDNPKLTSRNWEGKNPVNIILDKNLQLPETLNIYQQNVKNLTFNFKKSYKNNNCEYIKINKEQYIRDIIQKLYEKDIQSVIIEGGSSLITKFIENGYWDEARVFKTNKKFINGIAAPSLPVNEEEIFEIGGDYLYLYYNES